MLLSVRSLSKRYSPESPWALRDVDVDVAAGEFVTILGPSGAGKSTFIRCINRLVEPTSGTITFNGVPLAQLSDKELRRQRRDIGMIFQEFHLIDRLDVLTNVLVGRFGALPPWRPILGLYPAQDVAVARQALARVGLAEYAHRRARELSGGQRQRVAIARALTQQPRLILGDEPVSNLDPATSEGIMRLLRQVNEEDGITIILNLHSVTLARRYAHRIIGMSAGRIVFDGPADQLTNGDLARIYGTELPEEPALLAPHAP